MFPGDWIHIRDSFELAGDDRKIGNSRESACRHQCGLSNVRVDLERMDVWKVYGGNRMVIERKWFGVDIYYIGYGQPIQFLKPPAMSVLARKVVNDVYSLLTQLVLASIIQLMQRILTTLTERLISRTCMFQSRFRQQISNWTSVDPPQTMEFVQRRPIIRTIISGISSDA